MLWTIHYLFPTVNDININTSRIDELQTASVVLREGSFNILNREE